MKRTDQAAGVIALILGVYAISQALALPYTAEFGRPGAGFFPFWLGLALVFLGALVIVNATVKPMADQGPAPFQSVHQIKKPGLILLTILIAILALHTLGFLVMVGLFLVMLLVVVEKVKLVIGLVTAIVGATSFYLVFEVWLKIQLPIGIMGI